MLHRKRSAKYLGVLLDELLNWNSDFKYVQCKLSFASSMIYKYSKLRIKALTPAAATVVAASSLPITSPCARTRDLFKIQTLRIREVFWFIFEFFYFLLFFCGWRHNGESFLRIFNWGHLALGAYSTSHFLAQIFFWKPGYNPRLFRSLDWLSNICGAKIVTPNPKFG